MQIQPTTASKQVFSLDKQRYDFLDPKRISLAFSAALAASSAALLALGHSFAAPESSVDSIPLSPPIYPPRYVRTPSPAVTPPVPLVLPSSNEPFSLKSLYKIGGVTFILTLIAACCFQRKGGHNQPPKIQEIQTAAPPDSSSSSSESDCDSAQPSLQERPINPDPKGKEPEGTDSNEPGMSFVIMDDDSNIAASQTVQLPANPVSNQPLLSTTNVLDTLSGASQYLSSMGPAAKWTCSASAYALGSIYSWGTSAPNAPAPSASRSNRISGSRQPRNDQALGPVKSFLQLALEHQESALETILAKERSSINRLLTFLRQSQKEVNPREPSLCSNLERAIHALRHPQAFQDVQTQYTTYLNHLRLALASQDYKNNPSTYPNHLLPNLCKHWFEENVMTYHKQAAFDEMISRGGSLEQLNLLKKTIAVNIRGWNQLLLQQSGTKTWQDSITTLFGYLSSPSDFIIPEKYAVRVFNQNEVSFVRHGNVAYRSITPEYLCYLDSLKNNRSNILYVNHDSPASTALIDLETKSEYKDLFRYLSLPIDERVINLKKGWLSYLDQNHLISVAANYAAKRNRWARILSEQS